MRASYAAVLINLALVLGVGWGYVFWGIRTTRLEQELALARATSAVGVERVWKVSGVVRAVVPEINVLVITHEDIPGYMPAMTMGFRASSTKIHEAVAVGDAVRFTLQGIPPDVVITGIETVR